MSKHRKTGHDTEHYDTGYRRPPKHSQFKPGQSGNPSGRRKVKREAVDTLRAILNKRVPVKVDGETKKLSKFELIFNGVVNRAANGDPRATKQVLELIDKYGLVKLEDIQHLVEINLVESVMQKDGTLTPKKKTDEE